MKKQKAKIKDEEEKEINGTYIKVKENFKFCS
jgi:hypothetical protein